MSARPRCIPTLGASEGGAGSLGEEPRRRARAGGDASWPAPVGSALGPIGPARACPETRASLRVLTLAPRDRPPYDEHETAGTPARSEPDHARRVAYMMNSSCTLNAFAILAAPPLAPSMTSVRSSLAPLSFGTLALGRCASVPNRPPPTICSRGCPSRPLHGRDHVPAVPPPAPNLFPNTLSGGRAASGGTRLARMLRRAVVCAQSQIEWQEYAATLPFFSARGTGALASLSRRISHLAVATRTARRGP